MHPSKGSSSQALSGKEPWLAANLSMIWPGIGQIYSGNVIRGWIFIISQVLLIAFGGWLVFQPTGDVVIGFIFLLLTVLVSTWSLFDAHKCARKANASRFEELRKSSKDPWLAVFLSRIIPGLGHFYIKKTWLGVLFFVLFIVSAIIPGVSIIFIAFVAYHAYVSSPTRRERTKSLILQLSGLVFISSLLGILQGFFIRTFVAEARYIPAGSMIPTLQINDRLIIDKLGYRFQNPQRGDIVVFMAPDAASLCFGDIPTSQPDQLNNPSSLEATKQKNPKLKGAFIKRIIGLPGDKVTVKNRQVYVNEQPLQENYIEEAPDYEFGPVTVPPNQYLMLGDNRNNSCDSHYWGFVPRENIIGKATKRFWPLERSGVIK